MEPVSGDDGPDDVTVDNETAEELASALEKLEYDSSGQLLTDKTETTKVKVEYHNGTDYLVLKP